MSTLQSFEMLEKPLKLVFQEKQINMKPSPSDLKDKYPPKK